MIFFRCDGKSPTSRPDKLHVWAALRAGVAELVDAPDLGSGAARRGGSSPLTRTTSPLVSDLPAHHSPELANIPNGDNSDKISSLTDRLILCP